METLELHGKKHTVREKLGDGAYTSAYRLRSGRVLCHVRRNDTMKECLFLLQKHRNPHFPKVKKVSQKGGEYAYRVPYYTPLKDFINLDRCPTAAEKEAIDLNKIYYSEYWEMYGDGDQVSQSRRFIRIIESHNIVRSSVIEALTLFIDLIEKKELYHSFDLHVGNLAVSEDRQTLILLDIFCP